MFAFVWNYALPVAIFAYCYGSIIHVIRRHNKVVSGEVVRNQEVAMAATSRDQNMGQIQQQDQQQASAAGGNRFSHTEMNVLQTMIVIIVCFIVCWGPGSFANFVKTLMVCLVFRLDALALSVIATATWLAGWLAGWLSHSGIVSKPPNLSENFFDHLKDTSL